MRASKEKRYIEGIIQNSKPVSLSKKCKVYKMFTGKSFLSDTKGGTIQVD